MDIITLTETEPLPEFQSEFSVAFGNFDGLHLGHQNVIGMAIHKARQFNRLAGVMTFHPHPKEVLGSITKPSYLTPLPDKLQLLKELGVDQVLLIHFDMAFAQLHPDQFIQKYIVDLNVKDVVTGFDFRFGKNGTGTIDKLQQYSTQYGHFNVHVVPSFDDDRGKVSSSRVREALAAGDMAEVKALLQREYVCSGKVVHGDQRGRSIGFPTANVHFDLAYVLPREGVYAVRVLWNEQQFHGVLNVGRQPTFYERGKDEQPIVEVHILDFDEMIYSHHIALQFVQYIRPERKFNSKEQLRAQIQQDIDLTREILNKSS